MTDLQPINEDHRAIADKLMQKVRDDSSDKVLEKIAAYNGFLKTWQERMGMEIFINKQESDNRAIV